MKLRSYQHEAVEAVLAEANKGVKSTLVVCPTGGGKTVIFASVIQRQQKRSMVIAHREELIRQAADKIERVTGERPEIEMAAERADLHMFQRTKAVVATVQTLTRGRMNRFDWTQFGTLIIDEAHHAPADSYKNVIAHARAQNPGIFVVGVTATPDRADEAALGQVFDSVAFVYELTDAINDGYLVDVSTQAVEVKGLDFSRVHTVAGDLNAGELASIMEYEEIPQRIAKASIELVKWRKALVFAVSVKQAELLCDILNRYRGNCARWLCGKTPKDERRAILADFAGGEFQFLVNVGVLTEGYDEPSIDMVIMARPTKSRSLYSQMVGRGTRPLPGVIDGIDDADERKQAILASDKPNVEIIDFVGVSGTHKLITAADILGGNYPDEVVERASAAIREGKGAKNVADELRRAERDIHAEAEREKAKRRHIIASRIEYTVTKVNPFDVFGIDPPKATWKNAPPATERQINMLAKVGIDASQMTQPEAGKLCGEVIARRTADQCSFKQAKVLAKHGYDTNVSFRDASQIIDSLAKNGWKRPAEAVAGATH